MFRAVPENLLSKALVAFFVLFLVSYGSVAQVDSSKSKLRTIIEQLGYASFFRKFDRDLENKEKLTERLIAEFALTRSEAQMLFDSLMFQYENERINQNGRYFSLHEAELSNYIEKYDCATNYILESKWDEYEGVSSEIKRHDSFKNTSHKRLLGFHPFWQGSAFKNYDFAALDGLIYYGYNVNPLTGEDNSAPEFAPAHSWKNSSIHNRAEASITPLYLLISCYGSKNNQHLFSAENEAARDRLKMNIVELLNSKNARLCLDFQEVPLGCKDVYMNFLQEIHQSLKREFQDIIIIVPPYGQGLPKQLSVIDWSHLDPLFSKVVMGTFMKPDSSNVANVPSGFLTLEQLNESIDSYPLFLKSKMYLEIGQLGVESSAYEKNTSNYLIQFRSLEDANKQGSLLEHIGLLLSYIDKKKLGGAAIWCPGYEGLQHELTDLYRSWLSTENFIFEPSQDQLLDELIKKSVLMRGKSAQDTLTDSLVEDETNELAKFLEGLPNRKNAENIPILSFDFREILTENGSVQGGVDVLDFLFIGFFTLICFAFGGVLISLLSESGREVLFSQPFIIYCALLVSACLLAFILHSIGVVSNHVAILFVGLFLGFGVSLGFKWKKEMKKDELRP